MAAPASASAAITQLSFTPQADTYVNRDTPTTSYGTSKSLWVDQSPQRQTFLRFDVQGLVQGDTVLGARLRLNQGDDSNSGGRVFSMSSTDWAESVTYDTRPAIDGSQLASFGAVSSGNVYEVGLGPVVSSDGPVSFGLDSTTTDGAKWSSRESGAKAPLLILDVDTGDRVADGLSQIAGPTVGSSDPTYYPPQHRVAVTEDGRLLAVHGVHASGARVTWRDPAGTWQSSSTGAVANGMMNSGTGTGDWTASIATAKDSGGAEHAWVVFARANSLAPNPVYMRRLSNLDSPGGPSVGPLVEINAPAMGAFKPDIGFEQVPGGGVRGAVVWSRRVSDTTYETVAGWFTDLDTDTPTVGDRTVIGSGTGTKWWGTLVEAGGMHIVGRLGTGKIAFLSHDPGAPLTSWVRHPNGISATGHPSATALDSGQILAVVESDLTNHVVKVQRFSATGVAQPTELNLSGYSMPSIASDGVDAWIVMIRQSDGYVVSRSFDPLSGWDTVDRVEVGPEGGAPFSYPNLVRQTDGRLRFVVEGFSTTYRSAVLAFQRVL